jgi:hypothetical protein
VLDLMHSIRAGRRLVGTQGFTNPGQNLRRGAISAQ